MVNRIGLDSVKWVSTKFWETSPVTKLALGALVIVAAGLCVRAVWTHEVEQEDQPPDNSFFTRLINATEGQELWDKRFMTYDGSSAIQFEQIHFAERVCIKAHTGAGNILTGKRGNVTFLFCRYKEKSSSEAPAPSKRACFYCWSEEIHRMDHWYVHKDCEAPDNTDPRKEIYGDDRYIAHRCQESDIEWLEQVYANTHPTHKIG